MNQKIVRYTYRPAVEVLSGNVRKKLEHLNLAATLDPSFEFERKQMEAVVPPDIRLEEVDISFGAPWIDPKLIEQFVRETLFIHATVTFTAVGGAWGLTTRPNVFSSDNNRTYAVQWKTYQKSRDKWKLFTKGYTGVDLINMALNLKKPRIKIRQEPGGPLKRSIFLESQATDKQDQLQAKFSEWCREDPERAELMERTYNDIFNSYRRRVWDGSFLTLPGMTEVWRQRLSDGNRKYQKAAIAMNLAIGGGDWLEVGLGKTAVMIAAAMERRRIGISRKPVILVKKNTLGQIAEAVTLMYPKAKVLVANEGDLSKSQRQLFMAKVASSDWDIIVMTQEQFGRIPMTVDYQTRYYQDKIDKTSASLNTLYQVEQGKGKNKPDSIKTLERRAKGLASEIKKLEKKKDNGLCWEHLGIDLLLVDEYDCFKNLAYASQLSNVIGMGNPEGSDRALDFDMKREWLLEHHGNSALIGATGTPISNSMVEMWKTLCDFIPNIMQEMGIFAFDSWAAMFGKIIEQPEITPSGGIKTRKRFAKFVNVQPLLELFNTFSMVVRAQDVGVERPKVKAVTIAAKMSPFQEFYTRDLIDRAILIEEAMSDDKKNPRMWCPLIWYDSRAFEELRMGNEKYMGAEPIDPESDYYQQMRNNPYEDYEVPQLLLEVMEDKKLPQIDLADWRKSHDELDTKRYLRSAPRPYRNPDDEDYLTYKVAYDNMLRVSTDGRMVSLDGRLRSWEVQDDDTLPEIWAKWDYSESKVNLCARKVAEVYRQYEQYKATQVVFCDLGTPKGEHFSVYQALKSEMILSGIPQEHIAFIHDAKDDNERLELFNAMNRGEIRILIASTEKAGVGSNFQERLIALHHLDCPWRPRDLEQRRGRIERPGNMFTHSENGGEVLVFTYVTEGSKGSTGFDSFMWQGVEAKLQFLTQVLRGDIKTNTIQEDSSETPIWSAAEIKALATGDTRIIEYVSVQNELRRVSSVLKGIKAEINTIKYGDRGQSAESKSIKVLERYIQQQEEDLSVGASTFAMVKANIDQCTGENYCAVINTLNEDGEIVPTEYRTPRDAGKAIWRYLEDVIEKDAANFNRFCRIGNFGGMELQIYIHRRVNLNHDGDPVAHLSRTITMINDWKNIEIGAVKDPTQLGQKLERWYADVLDREIRIISNIANAERKIEKSHADLARLEDRAIQYAAEERVLQTKKFDYEEALGITPAGQDGKVIEFDDDDF